MKYAFKRTLEVLCSSWFQRISKKQKQKQTIMINMIFEMMQ